MTGYTCFYIKGELTEGTKPPWRQKEHGSMDREQPASATVESTECAGQKYVSVSLTIHGSGSTTRVSTCFGSPKDFQLLIQTRPRHR